MNVKTAVVGTAYGDMNFQVLLMSASILKGLAGRSFDCLVL